jgi:DNA replication and repair protein RecF
LCKDGGTLVFQRAEALAQLQTLAKEIHASLVPGEELEATYHPRLEGAAMAVPGCSAAQAGEVLAASLRQGLARDVAAGMTLQGPHRDDVQINLNGLGAAGYASRAQQRTIALSLRLAETRFLTEQRGEAPVLLLDDILSEMDGRRRESVLRALPDGVQMLITGADWDRFPREFLSASDAYAVGDGTVAPLMPETVAGRTAGL